MDIHSFNKHISPYFKQTGVFLNKTKPLDIQRYYSFKIEEGLSPNTVIKHHAIIRSALQYAVKTNLIKDNPVDKVDKPKKQKFTGSFYGTDELNLLFNVIKNYPTESTVIFATYYGLRRSEVLGLKWSNIDFENKIISVCHKVVRGKDEDGKLVSMSQNKMKSETSNRSLPLCNFIYNYMLQLKKQTVQNRLKWGSEYSDKFSDYICVNEKGNLFQPDYVSDMFSKLLKKNDLRHIRYHDLRHSCATLLLDLGYNLKEIQEWLGHADFNITANTYTHVEYKNKISMINSVQDIFKPN